MDEEFKDYIDIFSQDGVLLKQAPSSFIPFINAIGTIYIWSTETNDGTRPIKRFLEWKPNDVTIDSDVQDQEWAVVNTVQKRSRTLSGNLPADHYNKLRSLKINFEDIKRVAKKNRDLTFFDGSSEPMCTLLFQHGDCFYFIDLLKTYLSVGPSRRDKNIFIVYDADSPEYQELNKTFAALDIKPNDSSFWTMFKNIKEHPYESSLMAFSKVSTYVYRSVEPGNNDILLNDDLQRSLSEIDDNITHSGGDYELVQKPPQLPKRKEFPRCKPLREEQWKAQFTCDGKLEDVESIKTLIFRGGVSPKIREEVWKFLLDYYPWDSTLAEREALVIAKVQEYYDMKLQWKSFTKAQENNFSDFAQRKSLIEKDVNRTDRNLDFYAGDNNQNLQKLNDILMTYVMYNFDLGYVQGMSDLLSPILMLIGNEPDAFWCFVGFMNKLISNFDIDQAGMKDQLGNLFTLLNFVDPFLAKYLETHDCANMFFCFRWVLVWFKRELKQEDVMRFWEVLWTGYPCQNFHLLVAVAILEHERSELMGNDYGFTEILKHINELSCHLDMDLMLNKAEGIFFQIKEADHLTDQIRFIVGLPLIGNHCTDSHELIHFDSPDCLVSSESHPKCSVDRVSISPDEISFDKSIQSNFL
ncbi:hypothetical protein ABEB36_005908 [Hypothenemus hampei]|uniref:TBC1 domain family member 15 n=1 Tax=Hypothenemus hampei TaxID=57062 RepID=A0ABD1EZU5_HYPHA